ncbi:MAG: hypothetical protein KBF43_10635 [Dermatophilaceae bacterium]|nr:hypothetical protein [Dermatophilaceae bacterium]MBP9919031.1 hypothetical protein [Dermatophilaceae bacterium]
MIERTSMFDKLRRARSDLAMMNALLPIAEQLARRDSIDEPGAEHLLLAALGLDDGVARDSFESVGVDEGALRDAIAGQHADSLRSVGVIADDNAIDAALPAPAQPTGLYRAQGSLQAAFQRAVGLARSDKSPLHSGHILLAVTDAERGTVARSLEHLGVDRTHLREQALRLGGR